MTGTAGAGRVNSTAAQTAPEYLTVQEVAAILKISTDSVIRKFEHRRGVLDLGAPETRFKRRYRVLRIPREALDKFIAENRVQ